MRANLAALCLVAFAGTGVCYGQSAPVTGGSTLQPAYSTVYCSGFLKDTRLPYDLYLVSGKEPSYQIVFSQGNNGYINIGSNKRVRSGYHLLGVRETDNPRRVDS